jgi:hypothetical protein
VQVSFNLMAEVRAMFGEPRGVAITPMPLRSIAVTLAKVQRSVLGNSGSVDYLSILLAGRSPSGCVCSSTTAHSSPMSVAVK